MKFKRKVHHFAGFGRGGLRGTKIVNKHFVNKLEFPQFREFFRGSARAENSGYFGRFPWSSQKSRSERKQPKHKVFGRDVPGTSGTQTSGYPGQKLYASGLFLLF